MVQQSNTGSNSNGPERLRRRADARRREILAASARVFRRRGYAETSMREIAAEADLSPGNLYYYFSGKHELLYFCQDQALARMQSALLVARSSGTSVLEQTRSVIESHVRCMLDEFEGATAHLQVEALPERLRRQIIDKREGYEQAIRELITSGIEAGEFARCDTSLVTRAILGAANWSAMWFRPEGEHSASGVAEALANYLVGGLVNGTDLTGQNTHPSFSRNKQ